jgi:hypothetical protein
MLASVLSLLLVAQAGSTLHGDRAHPAHTRHWVETRLYFGLGRLGESTEAAAAHEKQWQAFLDKQVTPRFPSGLSVVDVYGQWLGAGQPAPERLRSKMLIVDYPATAENAAKVEAIRAAWKQLSGDKSVLRITEPADVSF